MNNIYRSIFACAVSAILIFSPFATSAQSIQPQVAPLQSADQQDTPFLSPADDQLLASLGAFIVRLLGNIHLWGNVHLGSIGAAASSSSGSASHTPFTALHTYYMSPTGSDSYDGTEQTHTTGNTGPWATPNHAVQCGDVTIAETGAYNSANFDSYSHGSSIWGTVSGCHQPAAEIDGTGGVYTATLVCATFDGCTINASSQFGMFVDKSN